MNLTYEQLADELSKMSPEQKKMTVTIFIKGMVEFYPINSISYTTKEIDVLDENHPILNLSDED